MDSQLLWLPHPDNDNHWLIAYCQKTNKPFATIKVNNSNQFKVYVKSEIDPIEFLLPKKTDFDTASIAARFDINGVKDIVSAIYAARS